MCATGTDTQHLGDCEQSDNMNIRDRVVDFRKVPASTIRPSVFNWRAHPKEQADALRGLLAELGFTDHADDGPRRVDSTRPHTNTGTLTWNFTRGWISQTSSPNTTRLTHLTCNR